MSKRFDPDSHRGLMMASIDGHHATEEGRRAVTIRLCPHSAVAMDEFAGQLGITLTGFVDAIGHCVGVIMRDEVQDVADMAAVEGISTVLAAVIEGARCIDSRHRQRQPQGPPVN